MKQEISILINGKEKNYSEDPTSVTEQPVHNEVAAAIEEVNRGGYTILATSLKKRENFFKRKNGHVLNKKTSILVPNNGKGFPKQIVAAIIGAIVTGTILGVLVLTVFSSDITEAGDKVTEASAVPTEKVAETGKTVPIRPINLDFSALQAGVFSSKERAEGVVKSIEEKGFSAVIFKAEEEKYSVIVGIGNEKHQLEKFNEAYQKEMDKPLFKSLTFSFDQLKTPSKLDETYFTNGQILLQNTLTLSQMPEASGSGLDRTLSDFNKWKEYGKGQKGKWSESTTKAATDFEKQLEGAFLALKDSKKGELNWAFQQKVMDSLQSYTKLLATLK
ncbi:SPOR domain-containing protein [Fictibacillus nanhaiensis]|uniref:SPOR domain-containing protein n=1 Tax=Fictibacillus nanhaiensis TaxID=742169 RepID=A0ABS2ZW86_9BACL|nr:SPOR domain-containing protein [Fictibacillus nanhaiensis]